MGVLLGAAVAAAAHFFKIKTQFTVSKMRKTAFLECRKAVIDDLSQLLSAIDLSSTSFFTYIVVVEKDNTVVFSVQRELCDHFHRP